VKQEELSFDAPSPQDGFNRWQAERRESKRVLAQRLGLPLGHEVEVWLRGGVRLQGRLELAEEKLFVPDDNDPHLRLVIGHATFEAGEIESCVRTD
jgi:hypothetical protein